MPPLISWPQLIGRTEKLLGGPAPFINLSSLLTTEAGFLASRARRLAANTNHPFFSAVRACLRGHPASQSILQLSSKYTSLQSKPLNFPSVQRPPGGLLILLCGQSYDGAPTTGLTRLCNQHRSLAEIYETIHTAVTIHKSLVNIVPDDDGASYSDVQKDLDMSNKLAILAGDTLLASVSTSLANFHNAKVVDAISKSIGDMLQAQFSDIADYFTLHSSSHSASYSTTTDHSHSSVCMQKPLSDPVASWLDYVSQSCGSILGNCCFSALLLADSAVEQSSSNIRSMSGDNQSQTDHDTVTKCPAALSAYEFGSRWASLLRLLDERDFVHQSWRFAPDSAFQSTNGFQTFHFGYTERGLPEPTLADALMWANSDVSPDAHCYNYQRTSCGSSNKKSISGRPDISSLLYEYERLGSKLAAELSDSFGRFCSTVLVQKSTKARSSSSAIALLNEMVDRLSSDANSATCV